MTGAPISSWKIALQLRAAYLLSVCAVLMALTPMLHAADSCNAIDSEKIEEKVAEDLGLPKKSLFAVHRSDLDDRLVNLQFTLWASSVGRETSGEPMPIVRIAVFDLSRQGYRLVDGRLTEMVVDLDDAPLWRVGYSCSTGTTYHLFGFEDSGRGLNTMISTLGLKVGSTDSALIVLNAFVALNYRAGVQELIRDRLGLLKTALDQYDGEDNTSSFFSYWRKISGAIGQRITAPTVTASGDQFRVKCYVGSQDGIHTVVLSIGTDGIVYPQGKTVVYRWPKRK
jgi:hypothetical protein